MGYFPNSDGMFILSEQCDDCLHFNGCIVFALQCHYNYAQLDTCNVMARDILAQLIGDDAVCSMKISKEEA